MSEIDNLLEQYEAACDDANALRQVVGRADKIVSKIHDSLWHYDAQPSSRSGYERTEWEMHREQMNGLIWKLHDLLRAQATVPDSNTTASTEPKATPKSSDSRSKKGLT